MKKPRHLRKPNKARGRPSPRRGTGRIYAWLKEHVEHVGQNCLKYPFPISAKIGYGQFGLNGKVLYAHQWMCEQKRGPRPSPKHEAAHTCGNAHMGCINPNHLDWKTREANARDRLEHGNYSNLKGKRRFRLSPAQVEEIRSLKGIESQYSMAERFGVSRCTISSIHTGLMYSSPKQTCLGEEQVKAIVAEKGKRPATKVAAEHGVSHGTIYRIWNGQSHQSYLSQQDTHK